MADPRFWGENWEDAAWRMHYQLRKVQKASEQLSDALEPEEPGIDYPYLSDYGRTDENCNQ